VLARTRLKEPPAIAQSAAVRAGRSGGTDGDEHTRKDGWQKGKPHTA
jgi:hypothetical protein